MNTGSIQQVQSTAHWTAIIATIAVSICLGIVMAGLAVIVVRDGNTVEVTNALDIMGRIGTGLAVTLGVLVAGPQAVSAFIGRFQNGGSATTTPPTTPATSVSPAPPVA